MIDALKKEIISKLSQYGQQGCYVNELFRELRCGKNDFVDAKNQLIDDRIISTKRVGKQKIRLSLNSGYFSELDASFYHILKRYETHAEDSLKRLRKIKQLFEHAKDENEPSGVRVSNQNVALWLKTITNTLEAISHYMMVFTLRYHIDPHARKFDLKENQKQGFETIQKIIEKLIAQHKDEEQEIRNYLLWDASSSFSYVVGRENV
jgi:hypothetical protein